MRELLHTPSSQGEKTHGGGGRDHRHGYKSMEKKRLLWSMGITFVVMLLEIAGGLFSRSLALLSDAGHMFTHLFSLGVCLAAIYIAAGPPRGHRTYGLYRAEILAALFNSIFLFLVTGAILYETVIRLLHPAPIKTMEMFVVAFIGLAVNAASLLILRGSVRRDINIKAAFAHVAADAVSSVGVVGGAVFIRFTGMTWVDPVLAAGISLLILAWAWRLFKESVNILLETAPGGMDVDDLRERLMREFPEIKDIYDMHVWVITTDLYMFTAHVAVRKENRECTAAVKEKMNEWLRSRHNIRHTTIEVHAE